MKDDIHVPRKAVYAALGVLSAVAAVVLALQVPAITRYVKASRM
ncbi:hypothetical protein [Saccharopolyspora sp. ASAGF58]|nr:hypothetical protein [Saccharopolyspora sp. ASAGF58]